MKLSLFAFISKPLIAGLCFLALPDGHTANFTTLRDEDTKNSFNRSWDWATAGTPWETPANVNWDVRLTDTAKADGSRDLTFFAEHSLAPHDTDAIPNRFERTVNLPFPTDTRITKAGGVKLAHPTAHWDVFAYSARLDQHGPGYVTLKGEHYATPPAFFASLLPPAKGGRVSVRVKYSGENNDEELEDWTNKAIEPLKDEWEDRTLKIPLPKKEGAAPVEWKLTYWDPGLTETTLAFLVDDGTGLLSELELGMGTDLFAGVAGYEAPLFFDDSIDLFVGIDLVQWLSFPISLEVGDVVEFVDGTSELFPGILVGTSPITFDPAVGFQTASPFSGSVPIQGILDGHVPESTPTLPLLAIALLTIVGWARSLSSGLKPGECSNTRRSRAKATQN